MIGISVTLDFWFKAFGNGYLLALIAVLLFASHSDIPEKGKFQKVYYCKDWRNRSHAARNVEAVTFSYFFAKLFGLRAAPSNTNLYLVVILPDMYAEKLHKEVVDWVQRPRPALSGDLRKISVRGAINEHWRSRMAATRAHIYQVAWLP